MAHKTDRPTKAYQSMCSPTIVAPCSANHFCGMLLADAEIAAEETGWTTMSGNKITNASVAVFAI